MITRRPHIILAFFFALLLAPLTARVAETTSANATKPALDIKKVTSPSGLTAWLVEDHSVPVIALDFGFKGEGARNDPPGKQGLARMVSNTMDEGAASRDSQAFQGALEDNAISLGFTVGRDDFTGEVKTLTRNKDLAFELLHDALTAPRFDEEPIARMKAANLARIRRAAGDPGWIAARISNDRLFEGQPYAMNSGGTLSSLPAITADDLKEFHKHLARSELYVGVSGDITEEELAKLLDRVFGDLPDGKAPEAQSFALQNSGKTYLYKQDIPQSVIVMEQEGIAHDSPDYQTMQVLNFILGSSGFGSRLTEEIREKRGLTYGIYSSLEHYDAANVFSVSTATANKNVDQVISLVRTEWQKMIDTKISDQELKDAKTYLIGSLPLSLTSTDAVSGLLLSLQLDGLPIDYLEKRRAGIEAVTPDMVQQAAKKYLKPETFTTIIVGAPEKADLLNAQEIKTLPNVE